MVEVYLRKNYDPNIIFESNYLISEYDYEKVAEIDNVQLEGIYNITQNGDRDWIRAKNIRATSELDNCRSSSIGDIFAVNGQLSIIMPLGYKTIRWGDSVSFEPGSFKKAKSKTL